jgi:hypothetical protein
MTVLSEQEITTKLAPESACRSPVLSICSLALYGICITAVLIYSRLHPEISQDGWGFGWLGLLFGGVVFPAPLVLLLSVVGLRRRERPLFFPVLALLLSLPGTLLLLFVSL